MSTEALTAHDYAVDSVPAKKTTKETKSGARRAAGSPPQLAGTVWFIGWLFTIGFAQLVWWKALLAIIAWPYFLGLAVR